MPAHAQGVLFAPADLPIRPPGFASPRAETPCLPLTVANVDGNHIVPGARGGVVYRRVDDQELRLDFWVPSTSPHRRREGNGSVAPPVVIVIHGGGFTAGSRVAFVGQFLEMLAAAGYPWVSIDYRLRASRHVRPTQRTMSEPPWRLRAATPASWGSIPSASCCSARMRGPRSRRVPWHDALQGWSARSWSAASTTACRPSAEAASPEGPVARSTATPRFLVVHGTADTEAPLREAEAWCAPGGHGRCPLRAPAGGRARATGPENWWPVQWYYKAQRGELVECSGPGAAAATPFGRLHRWGHNVARRPAQAHPVCAAGNGRDARTSALRIDAAGPSHAGRMAPTRSLAPRGLRSSSCTVAAGKPVTG